MLETAQAMHDFPRAHQVRRIRRVTCQFQRKIRLAGRIELGRTTGIDAPAAVRQLALADVVGQLGDALRISLAKNRSEEHTSELSHVSISYAVFCLKKKKQYRL